MDGIEGPFSLEIDYIGVLKDEELKENLAYETYKTAKYISNTWISVSICKKKKLIKNNMPT